MDGTNRMPKLMPGLFALQVVLFASCETWVFHYHVGLWLKKAPKPTGLASAMTLVGACLSKYAREVAWLRLSFNACKDAPCSVPKIKGTSFLGKFPKWFRNGGKLWYKAAAVANQA